MPSTYQEKKRTLKVLCRSCSLVFQMVNHRSQIHLAQTGDDGRSQTWVWDENSLIWIRIKWDWKHHFFWHWTCSSASSLWNARWQLALFFFFLISYPKLSQQSLFSFEKVAEGFYSLSLTDWLGSSAWETDAKGGDDVIPYVPVSVSLYKSTSESVDPSLSVCSSRSADPGLVRVYDIPRSTELL